MSKENQQHQFENPSGIACRRKDVERAERQEGFRTYVIFFVTLLVAAISTLANFYGIDAYNGVVGDLSLATTLLAIIVALAIGVATFVAWWLAAGVYPMAQTIGLRLRAAVQVLFTLAFVLATSTTLNLSALVGESSVLLEMRRIVRDLAEQADAPVSADRNVEAARLALSSQAAATCSCSEREGDRNSGGCITSSPGPGLVSANAASLCAIMEEGVASFSELTAQGDTRRESFRTILADLNLTLRDSSLSVVERREAFIAATADYRESLRDGRANGMAPRLEALATSVRAMVSANPVAPDTAFGREQARALGVLRQQAESFADGLDSFADDDGDGEAAVILTIPEPPTPIAAILAQVENSYPMIGIAIFLDASMLFFLGWLSINRAAIKQLAHSAPRGPFDVFLTVPGSLPADIQEKVAAYTTTWRDGKSMHFEPKPRRRRFAGLFGGRSKAQKETV